MAAVKLHYIYDPLCGWCYGATPLTQVAQQISGLTLVLHGGGMMTGSNSRKITPEWHDYVEPHDRRIAEITGQPFGVAYYEGLLRDTDILLDSAPPIAAILAAEKMDGKGLTMLHQLQRAHYVEGLAISNNEVLRHCAQTLGLDSDDFNCEFLFICAESLSQHIQASRELLQQIGGSGFPTFAIEDAQGNLRQLPVEQYSGRSEQWRKRLTQLVSEH